MSRKWTKWIGHERLLLLLEQGGYGAQAELSRAIDTDASEISQFKTGNRQPNASQVAGICRHFGVSADWLLGLRDDPLPPPVGSLSLDEMALEERINALEKRHGTFKRNPEELINDYLDT